MRGQVPNGGQESGSRPGQFTTTSHALMQPRFHGQDSLHVRAVHFAERIDLKALEKTERLASAPLMIPVGIRGAAVLFRYGAVVLFDVEPLEEVSFLNHLKSLAAEPFAEPEIEEAEIKIDKSCSEEAHDGIIWLRSTGLDRLRVVADVLARSAVLSHYEGSIAQVFDNIEPLADNLYRGNPNHLRDRELLRHIGRMLIIQHKMVGRVEVEEKPELLWENGELERPYYRMANEYELRERHRALVRKLGVVSGTAETLLSLLQNRRSLRVEWYIVILIVFEILLMSFQMFSKT